MKKLLLTLLAVLLVVGSASAEIKFPITVKAVHSANAITLNTNESSARIDLNGRAQAGTFSIQVLVTGDGTAKFEYLLSNDGTNFVEPTSGADIATAFTKTSGPGSDGRDIFTFQPEPARWMKIRVTETGAANAITVTVFLFIQ